MTTENELRMNIYIISSEFDSIFEKIKESFKNTKNNNDEEENLIEKNNIISFWKWIPFYDKTNDNLALFLEFLEKKINLCSDKDKNHTFKEVLIIDYDDISGRQQLIEFYDGLDGILESNGEYFHPFIIFLTNEEILINYEDYNLLDNKKIFFHPFPKDDSSIAKLVVKLIQIFSYYNELGDYFEINGYPYQAISDYGVYSTYLNILVLGRSQSGKSTFINLLLNEKRAKEGGNNCSCSQKCQKYRILNYPIKLYDTVGFGDEDKNVEDIKNFFEKLDNELLNSKEKIHLILYFIDGGSSNKFSKNELILLKEIQKRNILVFYIITKFDSNPKLNEKNYKNELKQIYNSLTSKIGKDHFSSNDEENLKKFFGVNLVKKTKEDSLFGFQEIIKNIYYYFQDESKILREIKEKYKFNQKNKDKKEIIDWENLFNSLKDNFFFNHFKKYKEIEEKYEKEARNAIKKAKIKAGILGWFPILDIIGHYFVKKTLKGDIEKAFNLKENEDNKEEGKKKKEEEEKKELEKKIDKEVESSFTNFSRQAVGIVSGTAGNIILENTVKSAVTLGEYGLRVAGGYALLGAQIIIGPIIGLYKMSKNGDEMIKIYKEKFREENYDCTMALIESILKGIEFFENLCLSFKK